MKAVAERRSVLLPATSWIPRAALALSLLLPSALPAQEETPTNRGTDWNLLGFGGGVVVALTGYDGGASGSWELGAGIEFVESSRLGVRLTAATWPGDALYQVDLGLLKQWGRTPERAWYATGGLSVFLDDLFDDFGDTNWIFGISGAIGLSGTPDGFGLAPEIRFGIYEGLLLMAGARLYVHIGPL